VSALKHRWLFLAEDSELGEVYLDADGKTLLAEAHGLVLKVTREGHGVLA
jgi:hypothetical protein